MLAFSKICKIQSTFYFFQDKWFKIKISLKINSPVKKFIYPSHEHELKYYSVLPYAWCCELGKIGKCIRKHEKNPDYYEDSVFVCVQCKFHICEADADAIEEERKKQDM